MNNSITFRFLFIICFCFSCLYSNSQEIKPIREFRGAWVATVVNIDFPTVPGLRKEQLTGEWVSNLDYLKESGMNAVFAQVRPTGDAFYKSQLAPWSKYLTMGLPFETGEQRTPPEAGGAPWLVQRMTSQNKKSRVSPTCVEAPLIMALFHRGKSTRMARASSAACCGAQ